MRVLARYGNSAPLRSEARGNVGVVTAIAVGAKIHSETSTVLQICSIKVVLSVVHEPVPVVDPPHALCPVPGS